MKLNELIARIDKTQLFPADIHGIVSDLDMNHFIFGQEAYTAWDSRVKEHMLAPWYCTDTYVGMNVIFMDDEPICVTFQTGRKSDVQYHWYSKEAYDKLKQFIASLCAVPEPEIKLVDLDEEYGESYQVAYGEQIVADEVLYNGVLTPIDRTWNRYPNKVQYDSPDWGKVALLVDGERKIVSPSEIYIPFRVVFD